MKSDYLDGCVKLDVRTPDEALLFTPVNLVIWADVW